MQHINIKTWRACRRRCRRSGFTLIELLAVMMIMVIITGITMLSFTGITRGALTSGAAANVQQTIKLARQYAITQRIPVAFILCDAQFVSHASNLGPEQEYRDLRGRAYAVWDVKNQNYLKAWTPLPQGTVFVNGDAGSLGLNFPGGSGSHVLDPALTRAARDVYFPAAYSDGSVNFFGIIFGPDGKVQETGGTNPWYHWVVIYEGAVAADGSTVARGGDTITYGIRVSRSGGTQLFEL